MREIIELREAVERTGASTAEVARVLGVSWQTVHRWIRGERRPSPVCRRILRQGVERLGQIEGGGESCER